MLKFIYSEKAPKFCDIFTLLLSYVLPVKSKVKISPNFVAFSEYMNFMKFGVHKLRRLGTSVRSLILKLSASLICIVNFLKKGPEMLLEK